MVNVPEPYRYKCPNPDCHEVYVVKQRDSEGKELRCPICRKLFKAVKDEGSRSDT